MEFPCNFAADASYVFNTFGSGNDRSEGYDFLAGKTCQVMKLSESVFLSFS